MSVNPFEILELPVTATDEQIEARLSERLEGAADARERSALKQAAAALADPWKKFIYSIMMLKPELNPETVIEAVRRRRALDPLLELPAENAETTEKLTADNLNLDRLLGLEQEPTVPHADALQIARKIFEPAAEPPQPSWEELF